MKKKSGFTLVELLVVLALMSIIVVMVAQIGPSVTAQARFSGLINNFQADYASAKLLASAENRYVSITFSSDGRSYSLQKQTDITNFNSWTPVKTVTPFSDRVFFDTTAVSNFAVNSTGEVRLLDSSGIPDMVTPLGTISLNLYIRKGRGSSTDPIAYQRTIQIFPYGGLKVEKH